MKIFSFKGKISFIDLAGSERGADVIDQNKQTRFYIRFLIKVYNLE